MTRFIASIALILFFAVPLVCAAVTVGSSSVAWADFKDGIAAVERGDYATALKEFRALAEQGHASAQYNLGAMYENGHGVPQDYKTALKWYKLAAEQGYALAQINLGLMYALGQGTLQDYTRTHMWWNIAASRGDGDARKNRDLVEKMMSSTQIETAQKLAKEWMAKHQK